MEKHTLPILATALLAIALPALSGTYTWTGDAGDGRWFTAGNWDYDGAPAANSPGNTLNGDDVVISGAGVDVTYVPGGDLITQVGTTLTVSDGAILRQDGGSWPFFHGTVVIDGGTIDYLNNPANPDQTRLDGTLILRNGGQLLTGNLVRSASSARIVIGTGVTFSVSGTVGADASEMYQQMDGGTLYVGNEFQPKNGFIYEGTGTINCNIFSPQTGGSVVTFNGPNLIMRTGNFDGFWQNGSTYIDVPAGSTSKFTIYSGFKNAADVYAKTFGSSATTPKFRYNGAVIDQDTFESLFTVEDHGEAINGDSNYADFYLTPTAVVYPSFVSGTPAVTLNSDTQATVTATIDKAGSPDAGVLWVFWGTTNLGNTTNGWDNSRSLGAATDAQAISEAIALTRGEMHYVALAAVTEDAVVWAHFSDNTVYALVEPSAPYNVWKATVSADSREPGNWSLGHVPTASEIVFVHDRFIDRNENHMDWYPETAATVAAWDQPAHFNRADFYVNFRTTANAGLTIASNAVVNGGHWTHAYQRDLDGAMLNVTVNGDMTVGEGAFVHAGLGTDANRPGGIPTGYQVREGPGYMGPLYGSSYAGDGALLCTNDVVPAFVSYGSILNPLDYGSGGQGDSSGYAGGGIIKLTVTGALTVNGTIASTGFGYPLNNNYFGGSGSGGTVNLTAASLAGAGKIAANGGPNDAPGPGSGGRVKVLLTGAATFDAFTGTIEAVGGAVYDRNTYHNSLGIPAAAGTVALARTADGEDAATIIVANTLRGKVSGANLEWLNPETGYEAARAGTHIPSKGRANENLKKTSWELRDHGTLRLTANARIHNLALETGDGSESILTDGYSLTTKECYIAGERVRSGVYTAASLPGVVVGTGSLVVDFMPTLVLMR